MTQCELDSASGFGGAWLIVPGNRTPLNTCWSYQFKIAFGARRTGCKQ